MKTEKIQVLKIDNNQISKISSDSSRIKIMGFNKSSLNTAAQIFKDWLNSPGVYLIKGENQKQYDKINFYVGQTDNFTNRILDPNHCFKNDWPQKIIYISSKDQDANFSKNEMLFFENKLINKIKTINNERLILVNKNIENNTKYNSEETYLLNSELKIILDYIKYIDDNWFEENNLDLKIENQIDIELRNPDDYIEIEHDFNDARGTVKALFNKTNNSVIIKKDTLIFNFFENKNLKKNIYNNLYKKFQKFLKNELSNIITVADNKFIKTNKEIKCNSVSMAAEIIRGANTNGWDFWIISSNREKLTSIR